VGTSNLDPHDQALLEQIMEIVGNDISKIEGAVAKVVRTEKKERRPYLWNVLPSRAKKRIQSRDRRRAKLAEQFVVTPAKRLDAYRHEQSLIAGIPDNDR
jgi:hypothetical protein